MNLLVFAQTPPPVHGQSLMVQTLLEGLATDPHLRLRHVNPRLSRDAADIGRWRPGKVLRLLAACAHALILRLRHGPAWFYYVPAPGRRGALYRDFLVLLLCRPFFSGLILHWHAAGLGEWLARQARPGEAWLARRLLGRADLAIVLGEGVRADAASFQPRRLVVVRNGIADPCPEWRPRDAASKGAPTAVFLGLCTETKGLFDAIAAVAQVNSRRAAAGAPLLRLRVAGDFPDDAARAAFAAAQARHPGQVEHVGFVQGSAKTEFLRAADVLLFPTRYPFETQGLVVAEALACDVPVIVSRWRAVAEGLPESGVAIVTPGAVDEIAAALAALLAQRPASGVLRAHFLAHLTRERHLAALAAALRSVERPADRTGRSRSLRN